MILKQHTTVRLQKEYCGICRDMKQTGTGLSASEIEEHGGLRGMVGFSLAGVRAFTRLTNELRCLQRRETAGFRGLTIYTASGTTRPSFSQR